MPAIVERQAVLRDYHEMSACASGDRLYLVVRRDFFWKGLRQDCLEFVAAAAPNRVENSTFLPHR